MSNSTVLMCLQYYAETGQEYWLGEAAINTLELDQPLNEEMRAWLLKIANEAQAKNKRGEAAARTKVLREELLRQVTLLLWLTDIKPKRAAKLVADHYNHEKGDRFKESAFAGSDLPERYEWVDQDSIYQWWKSRSEDHRDTDAELNALVGMFETERDAEILLYPYKRFDRELKFAPHIIDQLLKKR